MGEKPRVGVSACLVGEMVRYDGGHKRNPWIADVLAKHVDLVAVCPEAECGLGVPRERMHLQGDPDAPRLLTTFSRIDHTQRMLRWARKRVRELARKDLCGFILKAKSPSCGLRGIPVRLEPGVWRRRGMGLFARALTERLPLLPVIDEGRLAVGAERESFLARVFTLARWRAMVARGGGRAALARFHAQHWLLVLAHSPKHLRALDRLMAGGERPSALRRRYLELSLDGLRLRATRAKHCHALRRLVREVRSEVSAGEAREALESIERCRRGAAPLGAALEAVGRWAEARRDEFRLAWETYLRPHPLGRECLRDSVR